MTSYDFVQGHGPLVISIPHLGIDIPEAIASRMVPDVLNSPDTDRHVDRLYDFAADLGASVLSARYSRYVIDLNRPKEDENLYPGQDTTGLVPVDTFDKKPLYRPGDEPTAEEIAGRIEAYWQPYHARLAQALADAKARHGYALLWDAHSIRSRVPRFFEGKLPDLNLGTGGGTSCHPRLIEAVMEVANGVKDYTAVLNGRFKGGYITRNYGKPEDGIHAVQLELSQITYMDEDAPFDYRPDLADGIKTVLRKMIEAVLAFRP